MEPTPQHRRALELARAGHVNEAEAIYRVLLRADPSDPEALHFFGVLALRDGDPAEAERVFRKVLEAEPGWAKGWNSLGGALHDLLRFEEATHAIDKAVRLEPDSFEWRFNLAVALNADGRLTEAADALRRLTQAAPEDAQAFCLLGDVLRHLSFLEESEAACRRAINIEPGLAEAHNNLGNVLRVTGRTEAAEAAYRAALDLDPDSGVIHGNLANVLQARGRLAEAETGYRRAVELDPTHTEPYRMLSDLGAIELGDSVFRRMGEILASQTVPDRKKIDLHFAMVKILEANDDTQRGFDHLRTGNALKAAMLDWDEASRDEHARRVVAVFDRDLLAHYSGGGSPSRAPIFVLGMPRSGTTLVEQILASHSQVGGGGEIPALRHLAHEAGYPENCVVPDSEGLRRLGEHYLAEARPDKLPHFTDKLPENYLRIGLIRLALTNARIIHCVRDPLDTCLSCYRTLFVGNAQAFSYDLESLGREYRRYQTVLDHWTALMPDAIYTVSYEALIADKDREIRHLLEFCGLDFEDACLQFHKTERTVETASTTQVRREIYRDAVERWKKYESHLKPLLEIINAR